MGIGNNIRNIRKEKGMTLQQIADIMGCSPQLISQYESGKRQPKLETIEKIATALGCNVSDIREFDDSIRVNITPESKEISRIQNKLLNEVGNITPSGDIVYVDSDVLEYNRIIDKQKNGDGFTPYDKRFISDYIDKSPLAREWFIVNGLKSKEKNLNSIQDAYERLNDEGRKEAAKRIVELTEISRYTKPKEWFQGRATKEEIEKAVEAYLNDDNSQGADTTSPEPPEE